MKTYYASPERKNKEIIIKDYNIINSLEIIKELINSLPYVVGILNSDRQLIFSNTMLTDLLGISKIDEILGKRPGEFLNCINASKEPGGCGVAENCSVCGAVRTICESQKTGKKISNECRLTAIADDKKNYFDLMITAMPLTVQNQKYTIVSITDISAEKRKLNLERIFFHDIVNTAGGLKGFIEFMKTSADPQQTQELLEISNKICDNLIEHILSQKELNAAERGELTVNYVKCNSKKILEDCVQQMKYHNVAKNKNIVINHSNCDIDFDTDVTMLKRIIGNMIKNGLEASTEFEDVKLGCYTESDKIVFWVHNNSIISREVQLQIFQRSFSTKGSNRGLGTYSMKLLSEQYLKGTIEFESNSGNGTIFRVMLPLNINS